MLEHQKLALENLSSNNDLFKKEIIKSFKWLKSYEILQLHIWLKEKYGSMHGDVINNIFQYIAA